MTQQFDLAFKTANSMDKMMSNTTSSSFTSKENQKEIGTQFGSFLENANKNYSNSSKNNDTKNKNEISQKKEDKTTFADKRNSDKEVKTTVNKNNDNVKNEVKNNETTVKDNNYSSSFEAKNVDTEQVSLQNNEIVADNSLELEESVLIEEPLNEVLLSLNALPNIDIDIDLDITAGSELKTAPSILTEDDIPADALKSGIKFDTMFTPQEDATAQEMNVIEDLTKDMVASKDDYISAMYKSDKEVKLNDNLIKDDAKSVNNADLSKVAEVKTEVVKEDISMPVQQVEVKAETNTVMLNQVQEEKNEEVKNVDTIPVKNNIDEGNVIVENKSEIQAVEKDVKEVAKNTISDTKAEEVVNKKVQVENDLKPKEKENEPEVENAKTEPTVQMQEKPQVAEPQIAETIVATNTLKQDVKAEVKTEQPQTKENTLKQEINSAKLENSANLAQNNDSKEQAPDEFAKTNVDAKERMNIKDDVKGIEFVNNKFEEKQEVKSEDNKLVQDVKEEQVKQKVEQVKIQVEDNVKVQPQVNKFTSDENKMLRANETLEKAGLSTENLSKMNAKIKEVDNSSKTYQTDLGQSSREVLMRDIMQNNASVQNTEAVELKVDFNQDLNNKLMQSNNLQMPKQAVNDAPEINILEQIRAKMTLNAQNGMQKITIGLTPESLGKLNIEISRGQNGISAQIIADNPQAKEILDKNLDGLKSVLQSQGVNVNNVNVKVAEAGRSSDSNNNMFNKEDGQFDSNNNGNHSRNDEESEKEKRSAYEFLQKEAIKNEILEEPEQIIERTMQTERTISVKSGFGNVSYKL